MVTRYLLAEQCLNRIAAERSSEALKITDARTGQQSFQGYDSALFEIVFSVPDDEFRWFRLALSLKAEKYERSSRILQSYRNLNLLPQASRDLDHQP